MRIIEIDPLLLYSYKHCKLFAMVHFIVNLKLEVSE